MAGHGERALPGRRAHVVDIEQRPCVVIEIDATEDLAALAVLQAGLHELEPGDALIHGYDVSASGLGAWVGDRRMRLLIWTAILHESGDITAEDPEDPEADVLVIDIDPLEHGVALDQLAQTGRLIVASPEAGPVPLVIDLDIDLVRTVLDQIGLNDPPSSGA